ncbi:ROK family protein [Pedobacter sp. SYP-B3415]|uniref:ROK family protein n=1 Tax=Pedobacter sp. SYP-B3415 TaxID=2496641 RepID=UPI00101DD532|nr:ROK family protein [Pedobacter sp. SYP-B3415]
MEHIVMGVDIGGSHITAELIDLQKKQEIEETLVRTKLNSHAPAEEIIDSWARTIEKSMESYPVKPKKISIAMPGPMDYKNGICKIKDQDKYPALYNRNIKEMLASRLQYDVSAINFMNDAACFLKGELFNGSLSGFDEAIGLTLGTGLGTAHTTNGAAFDSDLWKMPFQKGIAEDYISTRWFVKRYYELSGIEIADIKDLVDNHQDSPHFKTVFAEFSENLAKFIHKFIRKKMPLAAVIGGNIVKAEAFFLEDTRRHLASLMGYSFPLKRSILGEKAALLGAGTSF